MTIKTYARRVMKVNVRLRAKCRSERLNGNRFFCRFLICKYACYKTKQGLKLIHHFPKLIRYVELVPGSDWHVNFSNISARLGVDVSRDTIDDFIVPSDV